MKSQRSPRLSVLQMPLALLLPGTGDIPSRVPDGRRAARQRKSRTACPELGKKRSRRCRAMPPHLHWDRGPSARHPPSLTCRPIHQQVCRAKVTAEEALTCLRDCHSGICRDAASCQLEAQPGGPPGTFARIAKAHPCWWGARRPATNGQGSDRHYPLGIFQPRDSQIILDEN